jgi:hypothetical protein
MIPWMTITNLGDMTAMTPLAATIGIGLALGRSWRMALWWAFFIGASLFVVAASKIAFIGWCVGSPRFDFTGFSGHAMRATAIAPVLFYLLLQNSTREIRLIGVALGLFFGIIIGVSRLVLHDHSVSEVIAGWALGASVSMGFIYILRSSTHFVLNRWLIALCTVAVLAIPYAEPAPTQRWLVTLTLMLSGHDQACTRSDWRRPMHSEQEASIR